MPLTLFRSLRGGVADAVNSAAGSFKSVTNPASSVPTSGQSGVRTPAQNKLGIKMLQYPNDVGSAGQGHYILFKIHEVNDGKIVKGNNASSTSTGGRRNRSLALKNTSKRTKTQIGLYMPPSVKTEYKSEYTNTEISSIAESLRDTTLTAMRTGSFGTFDQMVSKVADAGADAAIELGIKAADKLPMMPAGLLQTGFLAAGKVRSKKMELMFTGVKRRSFGYTFIFIPKSKNESVVIDKIIYEFKKAMLPKYTTGFLGTSGNDRTLSIPTTFDVEYFFNSGKGGSKQNNFLNKIATCYLTDMSVQYGGDRYKAYSPNQTQRPAGGGEGAPPQRTSLTLNFDEIEIITQEDIDLGF